MIESEIKEDLLSDMPIESVFQKHIVDGDSYFFSTIIGDVNSEYDFRSELARSLNVNINDVVIVGSAKLGFSLKNINFSKFDHDFEISGNPNEKSDIDVAVVNNVLFDRITKKIFELSNHLDKTWANENWRTNYYSHEPKDLVAKYAFYVTKGWLRPDVMPLIYYSSAPWKQFSDSWRRKIKRKISIGIYSDWYYLKNYQMDNLKTLKAKIQELQVK